MSTSAIVWLVNAFSVASVISYLKRTGIRISIVIGLLLLAACTAPAPAPVADVAEADAATAVEAPTAVELVEAEADTDTTVEPENEPPAEAEPTPAEASEPAVAPEEDTAGIADAQEFAELASKVEAAFDEFADSQKFSGTILVAREGNVLLAKGYGNADREAGIPNDTQTRYRIGSLTKPFTAMLVLMLHEQGLLGLDDSICDYVEECPEKWQPITIENLLTHTGGVPDFTLFPDYEPTKGEPTTLPDTIDRFLNVPLDFPPGERWNYTNSGYILLGYVIEQVTGQPYEDALQENLLGPLGMTETGYDHNRDDLAIGYVNAGGARADFIDMSIPHAGGALYSSAEDMLRWDRGLAERGLISAELQEQMFTAHAHIPNSGGFGYGYGWVVGEAFGRPMVFHSGGIEGYSANITRFLGDDTLIVMLSNEEQTNPRAATRTIMQALYSGK